MAHNPDELAPSSARDARAVRSGLALRTALLALIERKPLDQITVREITAEAGVHYATFFRHHATKEVLLDDLAADQIERLVALTVPILDRAGGLSATTAMCDYVAEHRVLWTALLTGGAAATMRDALLRISRTIAPDRTAADAWLPMALAVNCSVTLIVETLAWWLAQPEGTVPVTVIAPMLDRLLAAVQ